MNDTETMSIIVFDINVGRTGGQRGASGPNSLVDLVENTIKKKEKNLLKSVD